LNRARADIDSLEPRRAAEPTPREAAPDLRSLRPDALRALQRTSGNAAVCRALGREPARPKRDGVTVVQRYQLRAEIRQGQDTAPGAGPAAVSSADAMPGAEHAMAPSDVSHLTEPRPEAAAETPEPAAPAADATGPQGEAEEEVQLPDIVIPELEGGLEGTDAVTSWLSTSGHIARGGIALAGGEYGRTDGGDIRVTNIWVRKVPLMARFFVKADIEHHVQWDVRAGVGPVGEVDINGWGSPAITAANYPAVADALTPDTGDLGGRPPRNGFWAQDLTERHEQYHANDMVRNTGPAVSLASTWLSSQTAASPAGVNALLTAVPGRVVNSIIATYVPQSEERAYGDGVWAYRTRALAIRARGALGGY
jgi:hypothetical protein